MYNYENILELEQVKIFGFRMVEILKMMITWVADIEGYTVM